MKRTYYEQQYCNECVTIHWVQVTRTRQVVCHGEEFSPQPDPNHYARRSGRGIELIEKVNYQAIEEAYNRIDHAFTQYLLERDDA